MKIRKKDLSLMLTLMLALVVSACQPTVVQVSDVEAANVEAPDDDQPGEAFPNHIHFLGNSLIGGNGGVEVNIKQMVTANESLPEIEVSATYKPYSSIGQLWTICKNDNEEENFDYVIAFETFQNIWEGGAGMYDFKANVERLQNQVEEDGNELILIMGWGFGKKHDVYTEEIAGAHTKVAEELGVKVAPVGLAMEAVLSERPDYKLFMSDQLSPDWRGIYLASLVVYATVYGENPEGLVYQPGDMYAGMEMDMFKTRAKDWQLTEDEMEFLQQIAWETVITYPPSGVTE